ncbi:MAG: CDP-alcohol phosphatidyltransferase family protein [Planctomycetota bacterium]|nr:CDP-alcohol phosphatidyltransferase family protein [Planctomycetota bacterium]
MTGQNENPRHIAVIPNIITLCNAVCGFISLTLIAGSLVIGEVPALDRLNQAAWFILAGMLFDVFDGKVARATGGGTSLGAQLDSLSDLVTFGLAPAGLALALHHHAETEVDPLSRLMWVFCLAYFLGALLRLARFNSVRAEKDDEEHRAFEGMPTPGAAGVIASLVLIYFWLGEWASWDLKLIFAEKPEALDGYLQLIPQYLPVVCFFIGYLMVSNRVSYSHVATLMFSKGMQFDRFVSLIFGATLVVFFAEPLMFIIFFSYAVWPLLRWVLRPLRRPKAPEPFAPEGE